MTGLVIVNGARSQARVFLALLQQEMSRRMGRSGIGFIASVIEPLLHIGVVVSWHYIQRVQPIYGPSTLLFVSTGIVPVFIFIQLSARFRGASELHKEGRRLPVVQLTDAMFASASLQLMANTLMGLLLFSGMALWGIPAKPHDLHPLLEAAAALIIMGVGIGLCNVVMARIFELWHFVYGPVARLLIVFSGVLYIPDFLMPKIRYAMSFNPILHAVNIFRTAFYYHYPTLIIDRVYLWSWVFAAFTSGLILERLTRRREGSH